MGFNVSTTVIPLNGNLNPSMFGKCTLIEIIHSDKYAHKLIKASLKITVQCVCYTRGGGGSAPLRMHLLCIPCSVTTVIGSLLENLSTLGSLLADLTTTVSDILASVAAIRPDKQLLREDLSSQCREAL